MRMASPITATVRKGSFAMMFSHIFLSGTPARAASTSDGSFSDMTRRFASRLRTSSEMRDGRWAPRAGVRVDFRVAPARRLDVGAYGALSGAQDLGACSRDK